MGRVYNILPKTLQVLVLGHVGLARRLSHPVPVLPALSCQRVRGHRKGLLGGDVTGPACRGALQRLVAAQPVLAGGRVLGFGLALSLCNQVKILGKLNSAAPIVCNRNRISFKFPAFQLRVAAQGVLKTNTRKYGVGLVVEAYSIFG